MPTLKWLKTRKLLRRTISWVRFVIKLHIPVTTKVIWGSAKTTINWDGDVEVRVLSPIKGADYQDNLNDMSVVIKVTYGETSLLLTGDAESYAEELMIASEKELLQADVLKIGHHGSSTSSSQAFLDAVQPKAVVISLGKNNDYGHPHEEVVKRLENVEATIYRTDESGTILLVSDGEENEIQFLAISCDGNAKEEKE